MCHIGRHDFPSVASQTNGTEGTLCATSWGSDLGVSSTPTFKIRNPLTPLGYVIISAHESDINSAFHGSTGPQNLRSPPASRVPSEGRLSPSPWGGSYPLHEDGYSNQYFALQTTLRHNPRFFRTCRLGLWKEAVGFLDDSNMKLLEGYQ